MLAAVLCSLIFKFCPMNEINRNNAVLNDEEALMTDEQIYAPTGPKDRTERDRLRFSPINRAAIAQLLEKGDEASLESIARRKQDLSFDVVKLLLEKGGEGTLRHLANKSIPPTLIQTARERINELFSEPELQALLRKLEENSN